jgi:hypothetical protein
MKTDGGKGAAAAFYDGRSKEPCLMWTFDGYKPAPHDVVLYTAPQAECAPRALTEASIIDLLCGQLSSAIHFVKDAAFDKKEAMKVIEQARAIEQAVKQKGG